MSIKDKWKQAKLNKSQAQQAKTSVNDGERWEKKKRRENKQQNTNKNE